MSKQRWVTSPLVLLETLRWHKGASEGSPMTSSTHGEAQVLRRMAYWEWGPHSRRRWVPHKGAPEDGGSGGRRSMVGAPALHAEGTRGSRHLLWTGWDTIQPLFLLLGTVRLSQKFPCAPVYLTQEGG